MMASSKVLFDMVRLPVAAALLVWFASCKSNEPADPAPALDLSQLSISAETIQSFSGDKAHSHVEQLLKFGPRPPASDGYEKCLNYLEAEFSAHGWVTVRQRFRAATPNGPVQFTNLLVRHQSVAHQPPASEVIIGGHLDSKKLPFDFVGANDGGSSTGIILELARVLNSNPTAAATIEFVLFDGEEAFLRDISPRDGLYGSKYFARSLSSRARLPSLGIVLDIVGDPEHLLFYNPESQERFGALIDNLVTTLPFATPVKVAPFSIVDDHIPLQNVGIPCLHLIGDFTSMDYWHQPGDTLDKVDSGMLQNVGRLTLKFLNEADVKKGD